MNAQKNATLFAKIDSFPCLPTVVSRVMEITANPNSSQKDLLNVIIPDQAITSTILKMSNSAYFGLLREVSTLQQAITVLGFAEIRNLVLLKTVFNSFKNIKKNENFDIKTFWKHSFFCGLAAKVIAIKLNGPKNELFTAGLIHDIGKLIIYMAIPEDFFKIIQEAESSEIGICQVENNIIGTTHVEVGLRIIQKWMFPETLVAAVQFHHNPSEATNHKDFAFIIHTADILAHISELEGEEEESPLIKEEYIKIINLGESNGIKWNESDLQMFQKQLAEKKVDESDTLRLFL